MPPADVVDGMDEDVPPPEEEEPGWLGKHRLPPVMALQVKPVGQVLVQTMAQLLGGAPCAVVSTQAPVPAAVYVQLTVSVWPLQDGLHIPTVAPGSNVTQSEPVGQVVLASQVLPRPAPGAWLEAVPPELLAPAELAWEPLLDAPPVEEELEEEDDEEDAPPVEDDEDEDDELPPEQATADTAKATPTTSLSDESFMDKAPNQG